jgi:hypothetical protein
MLQDLFVCGSFAPTGGSVLAGLLLLCRCCASRQVCTTTDTLALLLLLLLQGFQNGRTLLQATSNSTFTVTASLNAGEGYTDRQVSNWLRTNVPTGDACDVNNLCAGTSFSTVVLFAVTRPGARTGATAAVAVEGRPALPARQLLMAPPRKFIKGLQGAAAAVPVRGRRAGCKVGGVKA